MQPTYTKLLRFLAKAGYISTKKSRRQLLRRRDYERPVSITAIT